MRPQGVVQCPLEWPEVRDPTLPDAPHPGRIVVLLMVVAAGQQNQALEALLQVPLRAPPEQLQRIVAFVEEGMVEEGDGGGQQIAFVLRLACEGQQGDAAAQAHRGGPGRPQRMGNPARGALAPPCRERRPGPEPRLPRDPASPRPPPSWRPGPAAVPPASLPDTLPAGPGPPGSWARPGGSAGPAQPGPLPGGPGESDSPARAGGAAGAQKAGGVAGLIPAPGALRDSPGAGP